MTPPVSSVLEAYVEARELWTSAAAPHLSGRMWPSSFARLTSEAGHASARVVAGSPVLL